MDLEQWICRVSILMMLPAMTMMHWMQAQEGTKDGEEED